MRALVAIVLACMFAMHCGAQLAQLPGPLHSSERLFSMRHYTLRDGLPHRSVLSIAQDDRDLIWLATPQGLVRFDGHGFMIMTSSEGLSSDAIRTLAVDTHGMLWVLHVNGVLGVLDPVSLKITSLARHIGDLPEEAWGAVTSLTSRSDRTIIFTQNNHLFWYRSKQVSLGSFPINCAGVLDQVRAAGNRDIWCTCHYRPGAEWPVRLRRVRLDPHSCEAPARITLQLPDSTASVAIRGTDRYIHRPSEPEGTYIKIYDTRAYERYIASTDTNAGSTTDPWQTMSDREARESFRMQLFEDLWLVNTKVKRMRAGDDPMEVPVIFDLGAFISDQGLIGFDVLRDRLGTIWIGGEFGLIRLTIRKDFFQRNLWNGRTDQVGQHRIRGMLVLGNELHVNTDLSGYWVLDAKSGQVLRSDLRTVFRAGMIRDDSTGLWRTEASELVHQNYNGEVERRVKSPAGYYDPWTGILLDKGVLLMGATNGLRITGHADTCSHLVASGSTALDQAWVNHMIHSNPGKILVCSNAGLFEVDHTGKVLDRWWTGAPKDDGHFFTTDDIRYIHMDSAGTYWLATGSKGLLHWDRSLGTLRTIGKELGMPTASIHAIYPDQYGYLWMPTDNGLIRYQPKKKEVKVYTTTDGLGHNEFNRLAHTQGPDGRMYFGGINGITSFHPNDLIQPSDLGIAPLVIMSIKVQREEDDRLQDVTMQYMRGDLISMKPKDRFFTVDFSLLSFEDPSLIRYAWRMDGINAGWFMQTEPHLRFTTLPYGDQVLRIKAQDAEGRWSGEINIPIKMIRPVHLQWWFIALCALMIASVFYVLLHYREKQLRRMISMRDRIASDLHDEVGSNLSSIVLFSTAVSKHTDTLPEYASGMLQRMKDNSKRAMESMNDIVWSVNSGHDSMEDLLDRMRAYAEPLCEAASIIVEFNVDAGPLTRKLVMEQRKNLYLIFKEAVSNAVRHSRCERITISLRLVNGSIELLVKDDGIGMPGSTAHVVSLSGNGLGNMKRRATEISGSIQVEMGERNGTGVIFRFIPKEE